jgi:MtN3 and saliva related transmembrane protein
MCGRSLNGARGEKATEGVNSVNWVDAIGVAAGVASMASFVPQIAKIWKDKDASGVSLRMFSITVTAFVLWTVYGVLSSSWPVAASNIVCLTLAAIIVGLRLKFGDGEAAAK